MTTPIEDYALIGDCNTAALVCRNGSMDWLCVPRFDSGACFAALLGGPQHGCWKIAPEGGTTRTTRRYRGDTLILETTMETAEGEITLTDFMPVLSGALHVVRIVSGVRGRVAMRMQLVMRFDYGSVVPWVRKIDGALRAVAGPDTLRLVTPVSTQGENLTTSAHFVVKKGDRIPFVLSWSASHEEPPPEVDAESLLASTEAWWTKWSSTCRDTSEWRPAVVRSLITLKALTDARTGGIIAAPTTSLPEAIGGVRNWDYRYCWIRDSTFTLYALLEAGYRTEAASWREWLLRAVAGRPSELQIMYGVAGERRLREIELDWLPGYERSAPVRVGNGAYSQTQLDVYGELMDSLYQCTRLDLEPDDDAWRLQKAILAHLETIWRDPDEGIWEVRGGKQDFTHSKVMAWVAFDRAVKTVEKFGRDGDVDRWRAARDEIHREVCEKGFSKKRNSFIQHYGSEELDASLLMLPLVGFLPPSDPRIASTVEAIEKHLLVDGFLRRYTSGVDGLAGEEGVFLPCTFWLADNYNLLGRRDEARKLFTRLLSLVNDVGLLAEEYDPKQKRQLGNFPQAFTHVSLINTARNLADEPGPASDRSSA